MEYNTNEKKQGDVIYVEPVKVEDRPLPIHIRAWEQAKRTAYAVRRKMRGKGLVRKAVWLAIALIGVAAAPALLVWLAIDAARKIWRTAEMAF